MATKIEKKTVANKAPATTAKRKAVLGFDGTKGIIIDRGTFDVLKPYKVKGEIAGYIIDRELFKAAEYKKLEKAVAAQATLSTKATVATKKKNVAKKKK